MNWRRATIEEVKEIVKTDSAKFDDQQLGAFRKYSVEPCLVSIVRCGKLESLVVVARKSDEVIYWEDVEEGFNISRVSPDGLILEHWCEQDELGVALNHWIEGRTGSR